MWREAGNYGLAGAFEAEKKIGDMTFPREPEEGDILEIRGEDYRVISVETGYCHVRPLRMKPITG